MPVEPLKPSKGTHTLTDTQKERQKAVRELVAYELTLGLQDEADRPTPSEQSTGTAPPGQVA